MIMPYYRDENGDLAIYDAAQGRHRFRTAAETATLRASERTDAAKLAAFRAANPKDPRNYIPHPHNSNRVSYGRRDPDEHGNWPQRTDGSTP